LKREDYVLVGLDKDFFRSDDGRYERTVDIMNGKEVFNLIDDFRPDEIYHLAAFHHSSEDGGLADDLRLFQKSSQINVESLLNILEAVRRLSSQARIFYAGSSHVFGNPECPIQDENTPFNPINIYGMTKATGIWACRYYRRRGVFASTGIMYNHESHLRTERFVSRKIIKGVIAIKNKKMAKLKIGNLQAEVDCGYAPDYVQAMVNILSLGAPDDFVVATGEKHSIQEFVKIAFGFLDLDWREYVEEDATIITKEQTRVLVGNSKKLYKATGWQPQVSFQEMIKKLIVMEMAEQGVSVGKK
jgi:GDPmannose 4,6-dehydratase